MNGCEHQRVYYRDFLVGQPLERRCQDCSELLPPKTTIADLERQLAEAQRISDNRLTRIFVVEEELKEVVYEREEARKRGITLYRMVESRLGWDANGYQLMYCGYPTCMGGSQGETQELLNAAQRKLEELARLTYDLHQRSGHPDLACLRCQFYRILSKERE